MIPCPPGLAYLPYQVEGIEFARNRSSVLFGDEMGLGKTIEAIGYINIHPEIQSVLVVCPATLKFNWKIEMETWLTRPVAHLVITNYDQLHKLSMEHMYDLCILDEGTYIKNRSAKRSRLCRRIRAMRKLLLTGTPILNRPIELWHLLHWLKPLEWPLNSYMKFALRYCGAYRGTWGWVMDGATHLDELREELKGVMIRRLKEDVMQDLPAKRKAVIELPNEGISKELWKELYDANQKVKAIESTWAGDIVKMEDKIRVAWDEMAELRHKVGLAKVGMAVELITDAVEAGEKVVVFAHHREVIDCLRSYLAKYNAVVVHGGVSLANRQLAVDLFQAEDTCRVFIGQIQAAGVGITLTASSHVVFVEMDWTPGIMVQAEDRCHRIGQKESVLVQYLALQGSLDARMAKTLLRKQKIVDQVLKSTTEERKEIEEMDESILERIAVALEEIVRYHCPKPPGGACCPKEPAATPEVTPEVPCCAALPDREAMKAELRKRGIKFKDAARTETLQKLLETPVDLGLPMTTTFDSPKAADPPQVANFEKPVITKEQVRDKLVALAAAKGKDEALGLLKTIGKADKLSDVAPNLYDALITACKVRGV
jgi:SWI/SNF-related matrix-associated actin-dependent regulator 1 of chromatin subfamily A